MLLALVLTLHRLDDSPAWPTPRHVQRWFKDGLEGELPAIPGDKALFDSLHDPNLHGRAYALSPVHHPHEGHPAWLRLSSVDDRLSEWLLDKLIPALETDPILTLDRARDSLRFRVEGTHIGGDYRPPFLEGNPDLHDPLTWAGHTPLPRLITAALAPERVPLGLNMTFATPTAFSLNAPGGFKTTLPFPVPRYVFGSLLRVRECPAAALTAAPQRPALPPSVLRPVIFSLRSLVVCLPWFCL